jgi:hypothetical protein
VTIGAQLEHDQLTPSRLMVHEHHPSNPDRQNHRRVSRSLGGGEKTRMKWAASALEVDLETKYRRLQIHKICNRDAHAVARTVAAPRRRWPRINLERFTRCRAKLRLDGTPTPRLWVARMTKRPAPIGVGNEFPPESGQGVMRLAGAR